MEEGECVELLEAFVLHYFECEVEGEGCDGDVEGGAYQL